MMLLVIKDIHLFGVPHRATSQAIEFTYKEWDLVTFLGLMEEGIGGLVARLLDIVSSMLYFTLLFVNSNKKKL
jgi:hypothetical protein